MKARQPIFLGGLGKNPSHTSSLPNFFLLCVHSTVAMNALLNEMGMSTAACYSRCYCNVTIQKKVFSLLPPVSVCTNSPFIKLFLLLL